MGQRAKRQADMLVLLGMLVMTTHGSLEGQSWVKPIALGVRLGQLVVRPPRGHSVGADNDRGSCAAFGALYLVGPGMTIGAILRATRTSGWDGVWVGTASGVAMGVLVGSVAAIVSGGDQPTDYLARRHWAGWECWPARSWD